MPRLSLFVSVVLHALALPACTSASSPSSGAPPGSSCAERTNLARSDVLAVVEQNLSCTADADCTSVAVASGCFDACSRSVNAKGAQAVHDAAARADATTCSTFKQDGCRFDIPPCAPPRAPRCNQGRCE